MYQSNRIAMLEKWRTLLTEVVVSPDTNTDSFKPKYRGKTTPLKEDLKRRRGQMSVESSTLVDLKITSERNQNTSPGYKRQ